MSPAPTHCLFLVPSASDGIKGEAALGRAEVARKLIPVPRALSSQCGVCLRVNLSDKERAGHVLRAAGIHISAMHDFTMRLPGKETTDGSATGE